MQLQVDPRLGAQHRAQVGAAGLGELLGEALADLGLEGSQLNCRLAGDAALRALNRRFAGEARSTDVLAFPARVGASGFRLPPGCERHLGDLVISVPAAARQARGAGQAPALELRLLAVHGLLHLLGHEHAGAGQAAAMSAATRELLEAAARRHRQPRPAVPELVPSP
ncbi:MAG: rRNA maturation RNase YbeY [Candidatus Dormibacteria bacterium]